MQLFAVITTEGTLFVNAVTAEAAHRNVAERMGYENVSLTRPATISEAETAHPSNITEVAA